MSTRCGLFVVLAFLAGLALWMLFPRVETRTVTKIRVVPETVLVEGPDTVEVVPEQVGQDLRAVLPTDHHPPYRRLIEKWSR